jgi:hypothetical protein
MDEKKLKGLVATKLGVTISDITEDTPLGGDAADIRDFISDTVGDAFSINTDDWAGDISTFGELCDILKIKLK